MTSPWNSRASNDGRYDYSDRVINQNPFRYGVFDPHSLHGPVYAFPSHIDSDWRIGDPVSSPRRVPHVHRHNNAAMQDWNEDTYDTQAMEFSTAAKLLGQSTKRAVEFFYEFQTEFQNEIGDMEYASLQTTNQIWKNKILFNETGHPKRQPESKSKSKDDSSKDNNGNNKDQNNQPEDTNNQDNDNNSRSSKSKSGPRAQTPIFHHLTRDLTLRMQDFNYALLPYSHTASSSQSISYQSKRHNFPNPQSNLLNRQVKPLQKHKAAQSLQQKITIVTIDMARYMESMRTNYQDLQFALTEMEHISDLLTRYWRTWGCDSRDEEEEESRFLGRESSTERDTGRREQRRERRRSPVAAGIDRGMRMGMESNEPVQEWGTGDEASGDHSGAVW